MIWKAIIALSIIAIIAGGVVWVSHGMEFFTKDREKVVTVVEDELFGTSREEVEWKETFKLGLLPDDTSVAVLHRSYGFILGTSLTAILVSLFMIRRQRQSS